MHPPEEEKHADQETNPDKESDVADDIEEDQSAQIAPQLQGITESNQEEEKADVVNDNLIQTSTLLPSFPLGSRNDNQFESSLFDLHQNHDMIRSEVLTLEDQINANNNSIRPHRSTVP